MMNNIIFYCVKLTQNFFLIHDWSVVTDYVITYNHSSLNRIVNRNIRIRNL